MSKININYMTDKAVETLKANPVTVTKYLMDNPNSAEWLKEFYPEQLYVTKKYEIDDFVLQQPQNDKDRETDIHNSILLYERLKQLPAYVLTDERFWCWMNFEMGYKAALKYMPVKEGSSVFKDHWLFTQGKRRGLFFGVISRCYFRVALTVDCDDLSLSDKYELSRFIIENPLRFSELSWRSYSSDKKIILGTVKAELRIKNDYPQFEERKKFFSEIAKLISKLGSIMIIDCMSKDDIEEYVYDKYKRMVEEDLVNNDL